MRKERPLVRELPQQNRRRPPIIMRPAGFLPTVAQHLPLPINVLRSQERGIRLGGANFPEKAVETMPLGILLSDQDSPLLVFSDAVLLFAAHRRAELRRRRGPLVRALTRRTIRQHPPERVIVTFKSSPIPSRNEGFLHERRGIVNHWCKRAESSAFSRCWKTSGDYWIRAGQSCGKG